MHTIRNDSLVQVTEQEYNMAVNHFKRFPEYYRRHMIGRDDVWCWNATKGAVGATTNYRSKFFVADDIYSFVIKGEK